MTATDKDRAEAEEAFVRGFHGIPSDEKLRAMSYIDLCELLTSCEKGTTKHSVVEREKVRRDTMENAKLSHIPSTSRTTKRWFERPTGIILLSAAGSLVAWAILRYYGIA